VILHYSKWLETAHLRGKDEFVAAKAPPFILRLNRMRSLWQKHLQFSVSQNRLWHAINPAIFNVDLMHYIFFLTRDTDMVHIAVRHAA
jgi:hypothetical protein